jgi:hypothetical protein
LAFSSTKYNVSEGSTLNFTVHKRFSEHWDDSQTSLAFFITTMDRNAKSDQSAFLERLYGLTGSSPVFGMTSADLTGVAGTAVGRSQYYGSSHNESVWVDGMYDYRGISDYVPVDITSVMLTDGDLCEGQLRTTPDRVLEIPDEKVALVVSLPGIWPSPFGYLYTLVTIIDDGDGFDPAINLTSYTRLTYGAMAGGDLFGQAVAIEASTELIVAGIVPA